MPTPTDGTVPLTGNPFIDGLTWGASWVFPGSEHVLTYSFSQWDSPYTAGAWTPTWKTAVAQAFQTWANVADVKFVEAGSGTLLSQTTADLGIGLTWELGVYLQAASLGFPPSPSFVDATDDIRSIFPRAEGDIWFDHTFPPFSSFAPGKMGFEIVIHEIGHALGLKHSFDNDGGSRPTFAELGISQYENQDWTVMSYTHGTTYDDSTSHVITPMVLDILAIQDIYGPNMTYHTGNDVYVLTDVGTKQAIWDAGGIDTLDASRLPTGIEIDLHAGSLIHYGTHAGHLGIAFNVTIENAIGTPLHDHLIGNDADNVLQGNGGDDYMAGGPGDDTYVTDGLDTIFERPGEGADTVRGPVLISLGPNLENAVLTGTADLSAFGNELDNRLTGNAGNNLLDGGLGADAMVGLAGDDRYAVDNPGDTAIEQAGQGNDTVESYVTFALGSNVEGLKLLGADNINGTGNELDNSLVGNAGVNVLAGGAGNDTYEVDGSDSVLEAANAGIDTVVSYSDYALSDNVENLELRGGAESGVGNQLGNILRGSGHANVLDGGRGADQMIGGAGDDTYQVDNGLDRVTELGGQGSETIISQVPQTLVANVENLTLGDAAGNIEGIGNAANNVVVGNAAPNLLDGRAGNDQLNGQGGDDTLLGGAGDDALSGGLGRDVLNGGTGADRFVFDSVIASGTNIDQVMDFAHGQDSIDLSVAIFTAAGAPGSLAGFDLVSEAGAVAHDGTDHVIHDTDTGMLYYDADGSGAQQMVAFAQVNPGQTLTATDFHLVA